MSSKASPSASPLTPTQLTYEILNTRDEPHFDLGRLSAHIDAQLRDKYLFGEKLKKLPSAPEALPFEDQVSKIVDLISNELVMSPPSSAALFLEDRVFMIFGLIYNEIDKISIKKGETQMIGVVTRCVELAFLVIAGVLKVISTIDINEDCLLLFVSMTNLSKMILLFQNLSFTLPEDIDDAILRSTHLVVEGAIRGCERWYHRHGIQTLTAKITKTRNKLSDFFLLLGLEDFSKDASKTSADKRMRTAEPTEEDAKRRQHRCPFCSKSFLSGKSFQGHVKFHVEGQNRCMELANEKKLPLLPLFSTICRVREDLRGLQPEAYNPETVGLGVYHNKMNSNYSEMWKKKVQTLYITTNRLPFGHSIHAGLVEMIYPFIREISYFYKGSYYVKDMLTEVYLRDSDGRDSEGYSVEDMVMDACFILEFFRSSYWFPNHKKIMRDIFKLENQIPLSILIKILELEFKTPEKAISMLAHMLCMPPKIPILPFFLKPVELEFLQREVENNIKEKTGHLLHLLSQSIETFLQPSNNPPGYTDMDMINDTIDFVIAILNRDADPVQEFLIRFKPNKDGKIQFRKGWFGSAVLYLPEIHLSEETEAVWWNLIAFEVESESDKNIIGYFIYFMDGILQLNKKNVGLLRKKHIITTRRSDQELLKMFEDLSKSINKGGGPFEIVQRQVVEHLGNHSNERMLRFTAIMFRFAITAFCILFSSAISRFVMRWFVALS